MKLSKMKMKLSKMKLSFIKKDMYDFKIEINTIKKNTKFKFSYEITEWKNTEKLFSEVIFDEDFECFEYFDLEKCFKAYTQRKYINEIKNFTIVEKNTSLTK